MTQADTWALTLQFAVRVVGWIEFQTAVLARDARIIVGLGGLGDYPIGLDQSQKKDHRYDYVSHIAALQLSVAGYSPENALERPCSTSTSGLHALAVLLRTEA
jgi:hypothetical protein